MEPRHEKTDDQEVHASTKRRSSSGLTNTTKKRKRAIVACEICRSRRTKCDGQRPACHYCQRHHLECLYQEPLQPPATSLEVQLATMNDRLDHLTRLLSSRENQDQTSYAETNFSQQQASPFKLLWTPSLMRVLGLESELAPSIVSLERSLSTQSFYNVPRVVVFHNQSAVRALAAFSDKIHIWYPIMPLGFSEQFFQTLSGPLTPSSQSCLALLVITIGALVDDKNSHPEQHVYFDAALASLPIVISEHSLCSAQCLLLLSVYYCCLVRPCQAHDYSLIASHKVLNLLKSSNHDRETQELINRTYWAVLLLESELSAQLDLPKSSIWELDDTIPLPEYRKSWQFTIPPSSSSSLENESLSETLSSDKIHLYFLAEIAMRRMLNRCNTAIKQTSNGDFIYAPDLAVELEYQLDTWYDCLPGSIRFDKNSPSPEPIGACPLATFLRVQYFCCKLAIFWPAVFQAVNYREPTAELQDHCRRFVKSYIQVAPSLLSAFDDCIVNRWTLFLSVFVTSMAAKKAVSAFTPDADFFDQLRECFNAAKRANQDVLQMSRSLTILQNTLKQQL